MNKEKIEVRLKLTEDKLKLIEEIRDIDKKTSKSLIIIGGFVLATMIISSLISDKLNAFNVFLISLLTISLHKVISDYIVNKRKNEHDIKIVKMEKEYYESILKEM